MSKISLNVVMVCGNSTVDIRWFSNLLTESYHPQV